MPRCKVKDCRAKLPKDAPPWQEVCSVECSVKWLEVKKAKARTLQERSQKKARTEKVRNFRMNDRAHQFQLTLKAARRLGNLLDKDLPCICCGEPRGKAQFCGGHYKTAGSQSELALDLRNIHGQRNALCNKHKSGNIEGDKDSHGYKKGLLMRYGPELLEWLDSYHPPRKYTCEELIAIRLEYLAEINRLQKGLSPSKDWRKL